MSAHTSHVSLTDFRADLLLTVADHLETGRALRPEVAACAVSAFRELALEHSDSKLRSEARRADQFAMDLRGDHDSPLSRAYSEAGVAP